MRDTLFITEAVIFSNKSKKLFDFLTCSVQVLGVKGRKWVGSLILAVVVMFSAAPQSAFSQVVTDITGDGTLGTEVTQNGNVYDISGGTRPGDGPNLFHSFGQLSVAEGDIANFQNNTPEIPTDNILGRVTGGDPSSIFGTVQSTEFSGANLFLMNPAGFLFGPNAVLNVSGSVNFTTADYLRQSDGSLFMALSTENDSDLTIAPIAAFGFLDSDAGPITLQGSSLSVEEGQSISLVGGDTAIQGSLNAQGGEVRMASVASPGEVLQPSFDFGPNINGESFTELGPISLLQDATVDVSSDKAGTVIIRGGELVMTNATISANTGDINGADTAVDIELSGDLSIETDLNPAILARSTGAGDAGDIHIVSQNMDVLTTEGSFFFGPVLGTVTSGTGQGGDIHITTGNLQAIGDSQGFTFLADSGTAGEGPGGNVTLMADNVSLQNIQVNSGDSFNFDPFFPTGPAGNVTIIADTLDLGNLSSLSSSSFENKAGDISLQGGDININNFSTILADSFLNVAGNITIEGGEVNVDNGFISSFGGERGGKIFVQADRLIASESAFLSITDFGNSAGLGITVNADEIELSVGTQLISNTFGNGDAGPIEVTATESFTIQGPDPFSGAPSGLFSNSFGIFGPDGKAGNITVTTPFLEIKGGGRINTATASGGAGGNVNINADNILIAGQQLVKPEEEFFGLGNPFASGIITSTLGDETTCAGPCGDAGSITLSTESLTLEDGAQLDSGTSSTGEGGTITVDASENISISGTLIDGTPGGVFSRALGEIPDSGKGGNISLHSGNSISLSEGAAIAASSTGPGDSGSVTLSSGVDLQINNGTISTSANQAEGGDITLTAKQDVELMNDSTVLAESSGAGNSGAVTIEATGGTFHSDKSTVSTSAQEAEGGDIGIKAGQNVELMNESTVLAESSGPGNSGTVTLTATSGNFQSNNSTVSTSAQEAEGGAIVVSAGQNLQLTNQTTVSAQSEGAGKSGTVMLAATGGNFSSDNSTVSTTAQEAEGGAIAISAGQDVNLNNKSLVSAQSFGPGNAGDVTLTSGHDINMTNSTISTEAAKASGGNIKLTAPNTIELTDSRIESSVLGGQETAGGNIDLDPVFIILNNSQILANATAGNGGILPSQRRGRCLSMRRV